jgi:hypothetical protein
MIFTTLYLLIIESFLFMISIKTLILKDVKILLTLITVAAYTAQTMCNCGRETMDLGWGNLCARCEAVAMIDTLRTFRGGIIRGSDLEFAFAYQNTNYAFKGKISGPSMTGNLNNNSSLAVSAKR